MTLFAPMRWIQLIALLIITEMGWSQEQVIPLDQALEDTRFEKSQLAIPLFYLKNDSIQLEKLGANPGSGNWQKITFPNLNEAFDTSFGFVPFTGAKGKSAGFIPLMVVNARHHIRKIQIWLDRNENLDFSDDGPPIFFQHSENQTMVSLSVFPDTAAKSYMKFSRFNFQGKEKYREILREYYIQTYPERRFLGSEYCFRYQPYRLLGGVVESCRGRILVSVFDADGNGKYQYGVDRIIPSEVENVPIEMDPDIMLIPVSEKNGVWHFQRKGCLYKVDQIHPYLQSFRITLENDNVSIGLAEGKRPNKFRVYTWNKKKIKSRKLKKTPVYIYIFNFESSHFYTDTSYLKKIHQAFPNLQQVWLYYGKQPQFFRNFAGLHQFPWIMAFSSAQINRTLSVEDLPQGVLFRKRLKTIKGSITPQELYTWLLENPNKL